MSTSSSGGFGVRSQHGGVATGLPGTPVLRSDADSGVLDEVDAQAAIVVATPGSEPRVYGGYRALLILDTEVLLARSALRARRKPRRWMAAIALTGAGCHDAGGGPAGRARCAGAGPHDLGALAEAERADRAEAHMPPAYRCVRLRGSGGRGRVASRLFRRRVGTAGHHAGQ